MNDDLFEPVDGEDEEETDEAEAKGVHARRSERTGATIGAGRRLRLGPDEVVLEDWRATGR